MTIEWKRDSYYTTRAGEKVRLICTDAGGTWPLIFIGDGVGVVRHPPSGFRASSEFDIIGPWVEPVKPAECWEVHRLGAFFGRFDTERNAEVYLQRIEKFYPDRVGEYRVVHMREVVP